MKKQYFALIFTILFFYSCNNSKKAESSDSKKLVIGASMLGMQSEYIVNLADHMQKKADELGIELIIVDGEKSALKQIE